MAREDDILEELRKLNKNTGKAPMAAPSSSAAKIDLAGTQKEFDIFGTALKGTGKAADAVAQAYTNVEGTLQKGLGTWRDLSSTGASFNNDIVGMTAAAKGARMDLGEFGGLVKANAAFMSGFGGNVNRGAEEFARLSKKMYDDYAENTDQLKQLGYTSKDLNEILALQSVTTRSQIRDGKEKDAALLENAMKLAGEMDAMAKLTGKSREAQMEQQRANARDMQFEAALRLKTMGMNEADKAAFEANARKQLQDAQIRGQGDMFKEVFATGQVLSKEAATQAAINKEQADATLKQARVSSDKTLDATERARQADAAAAEGRRAFDKDMQNTEKLRYASMGEAGGVVGKALRDNMTSNIEYQRNFEATAKKMGYDLSKMSDDQKAAVQKQMEADVKASQEGKNKEGEGVNAATKAMVNLGNRVGDAESALMNKLVTPLNRDVQPALEKLSSALGGRKAGSAETRPQNWEREMGEGYEQGKTGTVLQSAGAATKAVGEGINKVAGAKPIPKKALGGPVEEGEPYIVGDGGEEEIFVPKTAGEIIPKSMLSPKDFMPSMPSMDQLKSKLPTSSFDLNKVYSDIKTTVSGGGSNTIKLDNAAIKEMTAPFEKSFDDIKNTLPFDEFAGLDKAITDQQTMNDAAAMDAYYDMGPAMTDMVKATSPTAAQSNISSISMDSFTMGPNGMPIPKPKSTAAAVPDKPAEKTASPGKKINPETGEEYTPVDTSTPSKTETGTKKIAGSEGKDATLDDVVKALSTLNSKVGQLITTSEQGYATIARSAKSSSSNLYERAKA